MTDDRGGAAGPDDSEVDPGPPIEALAGLAQSPSSGFLGGVHRVIHRRILVSQAADLTWNGPVLVLLEYLKALFKLIKPANTKER